MIVLWTKRRDADDRHWQIYNVRARQRGVSVQTESPMTVAFDLQPMLRGKLSSSFGPVRSED